MKKQLVIYIILILVYIVYNSFFKVEDERINAAINILIAGVLFGYIAYTAFVMLRKMKK
ncbi:MAG: hypothetical protein LBE36_00925 [Flavobacteriaceae bacterium]|jgi:hypothetical protein|nr:hypothetical protein [Flavobacteriaceae bacterium]